MFSKRVNVFRISELLTKMLKIVLINHDDTNLYYDLIYIQYTYQPELDKLRD